jgi:hypothetical protein
MVISISILLQELYSDPKLPESGRLELHWLDQLVHKVSRVYKVLLVLPVPLVLPEHKVPLVRRV